MAKKRSSSAAKGGIVNRRARFDYALGDTLTAGIVLTGPEVRAARDGHVSLKGAFISLRNGEAWLNNASFSVKLNEPSQDNQRSVDTRARKLLLHKNQLESLQATKQTGMTIVPLKLRTHANFIKIDIAPGKGKRQHDKRETLKRRQQDRETKRLLSRAV